MWRALFIGWLALALAEDAKEDASLSKRQTARGNTVVYGASPSQYSIQNADRVSAQPQAQVPSDYQQQSELYVISPNRKPAAAALTYSSESPRRPQYIQLSALQQLQVAQQAAQAAQHQLSHQQPSHQQPQQQSQLSYESIIGQTEAGHGSFYRPAVRYQPQPQHQHQPQPHPEARAQPEHQSAQYAASAIVDSQAGSFERELAQLVAANRAQEQKYNAAQAGPLKKLPAPQQYLKEITRPVHRPKVAPTPAPVQYQPAPQQAAPLYRLVYQSEQLPQVNAQPHYKQTTHEPAQYSRPQLQQYIQAQPHVQPQVQSQLQSVRLRPEDDGSQLIRAHPSLVPGQASAPHRVQSNESPSSSRSTIYVSQSTPLKKPTYTALAALAATERDEESPKHQNQQVPVVRLPQQRNRPLTQDEFQQILQSGGYTATLVPSDNPNSPHQEYLLHPTGGQPAQRPVYTSDKQEGQSVTYLLPQSQHQRQLKRRPVYNLQQA